MNVAATRIACAGVDARASVPLPTKAYRLYAMWLLVALYIVNHLDRQVVNILAEPIKRELDLADWQVGMMTGLAFAVLYTVLGIPIARLAERSNRPLIIAASAGVWSIFTITCGLTQNFWQLLLARVGVGIGEAGCTPPAHSLIIDYNPPEKRSSALSFYGMGASIGALAGMAFGGVIADAFGWRAAFLVAGLPGLFLAALAAWTLREPRREINRSIAKVPPGPNFAASLRLLRTKRSFWFVVFGAAFKALVIYGLGSFIASFFLRNHTQAIASLAESVGSTVHVDLGPIGFLGIALGIITGGGGVLGLLFGGRVADWWSQRDAGNNLRVAAIGAFLTVPAMIGVVMSPSVEWALAFVGIQAFVGGFSYGPTYGVAMSVVPAHMRATASAMMLFAGNLLGLGSGPLLIGLISDYVAADLGPAEGVKRALLVAAGIGLIPAALFWFGAKTVQAELSTD